MVPGPGFGPSGGACASESAVNPQIRMTATADRVLIFFSFESAIRFLALAQALRRSLLSMNAKTPSVMCP